MKQKIITIGSSVGITIPKSLLQETGLKVGDPIQVDLDNRSGYLYFRVKASEPKINQELVDWTDHFIRRYKPALDALAKK